MWLRRGGEEGDGNGCYGWLQSSVAQQGRSRGGRLLATTRGDGSSGGRAIVEGDSRGLEREEVVASADEKKVIFVAKEGAAGSGGRNVRLYGYDEDGETVARCNTKMRRGGAKDGDDDDGKGDNDDDER
ncbi:hypothetical protein GW17_00044200 [Ensete ventricosum]|nr:hypothetical protein GW17_00044200 [Ensete ventricosum]